ncbi:sensor histidine kinase [Niabella beijingensis]|uniref:sensor histidine kinase n=1 Tax=Niabella beijingensis TaxID=2872700 RepID=UPI001CBF61CB|nr:two-component regulator propeller domain-containing protein [Niabella beijingensis]MBZ4188162.1 hypothetical protein [Niabella beijingensis]
MKQREGQCPYTAILFFLALMGSIITGSAQNLRMVRSFTMNDGLPSNYIYSCAEDDKGFLWVATDNGVCRFDGRYFKKYGKLEGVPDNDVLEVVKEKDGTIWINSFKKGPHYYDEMKDRFINPLRDTEASRAIINLPMWSRPLDKGGIVFYNIIGELFFKNRQLVSTHDRVAYQCDDENEKYWMYSAPAINGDPDRNVYLERKNPASKDSVLLFVMDKKRLRNELFAVIKNKLYMCTSAGDIYIGQKGFGKNAIRVTKNKIEEGPLMVRKNRDELNVSTSKGSIYVFDFATDTYKFKISGNFFANSSFRDRYNNIWVSTVDKGLLLYRKGGLNILRPFPDPPTRNNFRCIFIDDYGTIYGGNNYGEIIEKNRNGEIRFQTINNKQGSTRVLGILSSQNKIFIASEWGCIVDYKRSIIEEKTGNAIGQIKRIAVFNDSIILAASMSAAGSLYKINTITEKARRLKIPLMRISSITVKEKMVYLGTMDGLYVYNYGHDTMKHVAENTLLKGSRILSATLTPDGLLWVSTTNNGIFVLKDNHVIYQLTDPQLISFAAVKLQSAEKSGIVWAATRRGMSYIRYEINGSWMRHTITNLNHEEWISNNVIGDIVYKNDSVYIAAEMGMVSIPANVKVPQLNIKTYLTDIKVNQGAIPIAGSYNLSSSERTITLTFAGVNLSGYFDHFVYSLDDDSTLSEIVGNTLNLRLEPGSHAIRVRAVDINGVISQYTLPLRFNINAPFYRKGWFVFLTTSLFMGAFFFTLYQLRIMKQRRMYAQRARIEKERNRITEDLHDDIGSTLSSLKVYSDVAGRLMEKDAPKTKYLLRQISENSSKILEDIGDIIWSMRTDKFNTLSIDSRIKNFVSEVLGSREIGYEVNIPQEINELVQNITARKNVVLIVKEAINNIVKYSKASFVSIHIYTGEALLKIEVADNGVGFSAGMQPAGNGLRNMKKRAEELGGTFTLETDPENGTRIYVTVPVTNIHDKEV